MACIVSCLSVFKVGQSFHIPRFQLSLFTRAMFFQNTDFSMANDIPDLPMGGIYGSLAAGAYSVVLSNPTTKPPIPSSSPSLSSNKSNVQTPKYPATDIDLGSIIYYSSTVKPLKSGPRSSPSSPSTPANKNPNTNKGSLILTKSIETGHTIRVIRKWTCDFENRPCVGYRYEGLYKAVGKEERVVLHSNKQEDGNMDDGIQASVEEESCGYFWTVFKLERCSGQRDIDTSRPTVEEQRDFARIECGF